MNELQGSEAPVMDQGQWECLLAFLDAMRRSRQTVTYRDVIEHLALPSPAMKRVAGALERLIWRDSRAGQPLRSALVVSQGPDRLPRQGFFDCAKAAGRIAAPLSVAEQPRWHAAELERVFDHAYLDEHVSFAIPHQDDASR